MAIYPDPDRVTYVSFPRALSADEARMEHAQRRHAEALAAEASALAARQQQQPTEEGKTDERA